MELPKLPDRPMLHSFNSATGEYVGSDIPEYDLLHLQKANELKFMDLPFTTFEELPPFEEKSKPVFANGKWVVLKDHRGEVWYSTGNVPHQINFLGDPAERGLTSERLVIEDVDAVKRQRQNELLTKLTIVSQQIGSYRPSEIIPPELLERRKTINAELNALEE